MDMQIFIFSSCLCKIIKEVCNMPIMSLEKKNSSSKLEHCVFNFMGFYIWSYILVVPKLLSDFPSIISSSSILK